ncbi:thioredoxin family protein [Aureisphaera galaxeae]|uniref:TlpA family protein disulfide reductase n=1 Tax=Aureisphaera galaxeae TaxID=1538023 RepID=UPI00234FDDAD|nr:thioredoxin family protein [Aureisphaera galaxeae]MDC8006055.1 thioredoxin family protein [Aureisphaera galaxeae]
MKYILICFTLVSLIACKSNTKEETIEEGTTETEMVEVDPSKTINVRVPDEEDGGEMLLGEINCKGLQEEPFKEWFTENYNLHVLDSTVVDSLAPLLKDVTIKTFMGSWCEDSQREVPALFKVLDQVDYEEKNVHMIAMTHDKTTPQNFEKDLNIEYVPTIIFYKDGKELNRIVEYPQQTLEKDMLSILKGLPYKHAYEE